MTSRLTFVTLACAFALACSGSGNDRPAGQTPVSPSPTPAPAPSTPLPLWIRSGTGNDVFNKPVTVTRVRITGSYTANSSNFVIWCGTNLLVNELLGTGWGVTSYSGTHATPNCTQIEVRLSTGVNWTLTEVR